MGHDPNRAYFRPAANKRLTHLWPWYFLTQPNDFYFDPNGKKLKNLEFSKLAQTQNGWPDPTGAKKLSQPITKGRCLIWAPLQSMVSIPLDRFHSLHSWSEPYPCRLMLFHHKIVQYWFISLLGKSSLAYVITILCVSLARPPSSTTPQPFSFLFKLGIRHFAMYRFAICRFATVSLP